MSEEGKESHHHHHFPHHHHHFPHHHHHGEDQPAAVSVPVPPPEYGTFQASSQPVMGFPQPVPPPGATGAPTPEYYAHGYQAVPGYTAPDPEGRPERHHRLPCCGIGLGWFLFIIGFLLAGIPWYLAAFVLLCAQIDPREKPGYIASTIAAVLATFVLVFGLSKD
ncbi:60S ribosomal protein L18a-like protein [Solanum verrucosum]|uniref:60S ribosomal protein L18a-like protein n=1 Tax=Solanum verrucosum TaxID=315347 RepID=UPI0020D1DF46|nr:60S ribosomal protein L18a-like protein [Solanum verrucosum]XP_049404800.1 60S ribosomal protein L18a-like protein [Solanum stenotomum]